MSRWQDSSLLADGLESSTPFQGTSPRALLLPLRRKSTWVESTLAWGLGDLGPCPSPLGDFSSLSLAISSTWCGPPVWNL